MTTTNDKHDISAFENKDSEMYRQAFQVFDTNKDGEIELNELDMLLRSLGQHLTEPELITLISKISTNGKSLNFSQFLLMIKQTHMLENRDEIISAFKVFDHDKNGYASQKELKHVLKTLGEKLTDEEIDDIFQGIEVVNGQFKYSDIADKFCNNKALY